MMIKLRLGGHSTSAGLLRRVGPGQRLYDLSECVEVCRVEADDLPNRL